MTKHNARKVRCPKSIHGWKFFFFLAIVVSLAACSSKSNARSDKKDSDSADSTPVKTARAQLKPMERTVTVTGSFSAREQATLSVKVPGRLEKLTVDIGSVVEKGDLLAQIERGDYELRVKQAEAALAQARARLGLSLQGTDDTIELENTGTIRQATALLEEAARNLNRIKELAAQKISSQAELDTAQAGHTVAENRYQNAVEEVRERQALLTQRRTELNIAQKQLADSGIRAPFSGIVHQRRAGLGEYLETGTPLLVIAAVEPLRLRLEVPERQSTQVRPGQPLRITVEGNTNFYLAEITRVSPILSESNRMLVVEADVPAAPALRPGLFAQGTIVINANDPALCIPESAVSSFVGVEKVFLVREGKAMEKGITTGRRKDGFVEVLAGLKEGDAVIVSPGKIRSDQTVIEEAHATAR